jgi:hypothetical protein
MLRVLSICWAGFLLHAQPPAKGPTFDVASVKLLSNDDRKVPVFSGGPGSSEPGRLHLRVNMSLLLGAVFGVSVDQIKGPAWLRDFSAMPFYDISATMSVDSSKKQVEHMLQNRWLRGSAWSSTKKQGISRATNWSWIRVVQN